MTPFRQFLRLIRINLILARHGLDQVIVTLHLFSPLRFIVYFNPWNWFRRDTLNRAEAVRCSLEELGPIFVKFGQALSTRPDILPPDIAAELCKLQDRVLPFSSEVALELIAQTFGRSAFEVFAQFDPLPLASASISQVHAAKLTSGEEVVVKILRPNIEALIVQDLALLKTIAKLAHRYWPDAKRFKPLAVVEEFEQSLLDELDLMREAANGSQLRRNFENSPLLYIPKIYWDYSHRQILVTERIYGIPVSDITTLNHHRIHIKKLAERGLEIFFTQVFRDCFFHADMHPGNIFVSPLHPDNPQYLCVDFGIIGTLNERDKRYIAENLLAFFNRDYRRVAELHIESAWVDRRTRIDEFESAIRTICEPIFERPLKDISFAMLMLRLFQVARRFQMEVQPQLVLLQKTLLAVEGLGRQLYPELDIWVTAKPFLERWLREQVSAKAFLKQLKQQAPFIVEQLPHLPRLVHDVLQLKKELAVSSIENDTKRLLNQRRRHKTRIGFLWGSALMALLLSAQNYWHWIPSSILSITLLGITGLSGLLALILQR